MLTRVFWAWQGGLAAMKFAKNHSRGSHASHRGRGELRLYEAGFDGVHPNIVIGPFMGLAAGEGRHRCFCSCVDGNCVRTSDSQRERA